MSHSVILMTALVPTTGHADLISFAESMSRQVSVIISSRSFEPIPGQVRVDAFREHFIGHEGIHIHLHEDDEAPQNSDGSSEFWDYWQKVVLDKTSRYGEVTHVVASEKYGKEMAYALGLKFIPYDIDRQINGVTGSDVRESFANPGSGLKGVLPEFRKNLTRNYVLMGPESVGKTTLTNILTTLFSTEDDSYTTGSYPEFARTYLENAHYSDVQTETLKITEGMMHDIEKGQYHLDIMARKSGRFQVNIQDTDLLSTVGYYEIFNGKNTEKINPSKIFRYLALYVLDNNQNTKYFILPDDIPVEVDPLRAGGSQRESSYEFWVDLARDHGVEYVEVPRGDITWKLKMMVSTIIDDMQDMYESIANFVRE